MNEKAQNSFPKEWRLLKRPLFLKLSTQGTKVYTKYFIAAVLENSCHNHRIGITVSKKVGNAVKRNQVKRIIRESVRHKKEQIIKSDTTKFYDINIIAKKEISHLTNFQIMNSLDTLFTRLSLSLIPKESQKLEL